MSDIHDDTDMVRCFQLPDVQDLQGQVLMPQVETKSVMCYRDGCVSYVWKPMCMHRVHLALWSHQVLCGSFYVPYIISVHSFIHLYMYTDTGIDNVIHIHWRRHSQMSGGKYSVNTQNKVSPVSQQQVCVIYLHWHWHRQCQTHNMSDT